YVVPEWDAELRALLSLGNGVIETDEFERRVSFMSGSAEDWAIWRAARARRNVALEVVLDEAGRMDWPKIRSRGSEESQAQCRLLCDIFGNPFRTVALESTWLTTNVVSLAQAIYDDRAFERMPILADALEDAGCDSADILNHCRGPGP